MSTQQLNEHFMMEMEKCLNEIASASVLQSWVEEIGPFITQRFRKMLTKSVEGHYNRMMVVRNLLQVLGHSDIEALGVFLTAVQQNSRFPEIRSEFQGILQAHNLESFYVPEKNKSGIKKHNEITTRANQAQLFLIESFMATIVRDSAKEDKENFRKSCMKFLDGGFVFKFVILNAIIDDMLSYAESKTVALEEARIAMQNMLPYALNLIRSPTRKEFKIVKKYTAHYQVRIKNNLKWSPSTADSILDAMGYKPTEYPDQVALGRPTRFILDLAFEIYLCELKLDRIATMIKRLTARYDIGDKIVLSAWLELVQSKPGPVSEREVIRYLRELDKQKDNDIVMGGGSLMTGRVTKIERTKVTDIVNPKTEKKVSVSQAGYQKKTSSGCQNYDHLDDDEWMYASHPEKTVSYYEPVDERMFRQLKRSGIDSFGSLKNDSSLYSNQAYGTVVNFETEHSRSRKGSLAGDNASNPKSSSDVLPADYSIYGNIKSTISKLPPADQQDYLQTARISKAVETNSASHEPSYYENAMGQGRELQSVRKQSSFEKERESNNQAVVAAKLLSSVGDSIDRDFRHRMISDNVKLKYNMLPPNDVYENYTGSKVASQIALGRKSEDREANNVVMGIPSSYDNLLPQGENVTAADEIYVDPNQLTRPSSDNNEKIIRYQITSGNVDHHMPFRSPNDDASIYENFSADKMAASQTAPGAKELGDATKRLPSVYHSLPPQGGNPTAVDIIHANSRPRMPQIYHSPSDNEAD
eukprot:gene19182-21104_t